MQVDKFPFPMHMVEKGEPAVLIRPEQADSTQGKNVIIGEPREVPKVEKVVGRKVVLEKNEDGKNQLKTIASSTKYLNKHRHDEAVATQQRPARPVSHNSQTGQASSSGSSSPENRKLRTFVPKRPEFGTWKSNKDKNKGKFVKRQCTFDRLMAKYKKEKANSMNRRFKKREPSLPKQDDRSKQMVVAQVTVLVQQRVAPHVSSWGPLVLPPITPQWGPYGVWVPYPPAAPMHHQQRWGEPASYDS